MPSSLKIGDLFSYVLEPGTRCVEMKILQVLSWTLPLLPHDSWSYRSRWAGTLEHIRPWQQQQQHQCDLDIQIPGPSSKRQKTSIQYESSLKRSFPYVSLCLDESGQNICMDTIISNVYIKIPDSSVSLQAMLGEVAGKIGESPTELILLDSKFIEIGDDSRGKFVHTV